MSKINKAISLIKRFEGLMLKPYICAGGKKTIGYGHTNLYTDNEITKEYAEILLYRDVCEVLIYMINTIKVTLNDNQLSAIISFIFNVGIGNFKRSTLLKKLNKEDFEGAAEEFDKWIFSNGKKLDGLVNRRYEEKELFNRK